MKLTAIIASVFVGTASAELSDQTKEHPHRGSGSTITETRVVARDGKTILHTMDYSDPDGTVTQRNHLLHVAGDWVATLEDNAADGTLDGVALIHPTTRALEYFYVEGDMKLVPASDEEMADAKSIGEDVGALMEGVLEGDEITTASIQSLRFRIWLRKWEVSMILTAGILAVVAFVIGRKTATKRSEQDEDTNPPPLCS